MVQSSLATTTINNVKAIELVGVDNALTNAQDVPIGAVVKAINIEMWVMAAAAATGATTLIVEKLNQNSSPANFSQMSALNAYANKANILWSSQGIIAEEGANPTPFIREWLAIPKGKQRFAQGDSLYLVIQAPTGSISTCGRSVFKSYE